MKSKINFWILAGIACFLRFGTINAQPLVTYPNGGEKLTVGSLVKITWSGTVLNTTVAIDYTINNWTSTIWINTNYQNATENSYTWTVPNSQGTQCKVGVFDASSAGDVSDNFFTIKAASDLNNCTLSNSVNVYPNPARDILHITSISGSILNFRLFDLSGKEIDIEVLVEGEGNYRIERGALENGIYTIMICDDQDGSFMYKKIVID